MDIAACPRCASLELSLPSLGDSGLSGITATKEAVCDRCGFQGTPLLFAELEDYRSFRDTVGQRMDPLEEVQEQETDADRADDEPAEGFDLLEGTQRGGARGSAVFVGVLGLVLSALGLWAIVAAGLGALGVGVRDAPTLPDPLGLAFMLVLLGVGMALLRVAWRMWQRPAETG